MPRTAAPPDRRPAPSGLAELTSAELMDMATASAQRLASEAAFIVLAAGELNRREAWREDGATSLEAWLMERTGVSAATARSWAHVADRLADLPHLASALSSGSLSFDKVRALVDGATPESDLELCEIAPTASVRELAELARRRTLMRRRTPTDADDPSASPQPENPAGTLRFNDNCRTMTAQLNPETYAEVRESVEAQAKAIPSDGETPWDARMAMGLLALVRSGQGTTRPGRAGTSHVVVSHVPLADLVDEEAEPTTLCAELEHDGLISLEVVRRLACEGSVIVAIDDDVGRTMYEGRATRDPTDAQRREIWRRDRHCRFPGCGNVTFTHLHHFPPWKPGGRTDIDALVTLCEYHHHRMHSRGWTMRGDANDELTFVAPSGRTKVSRPSPLWTSVTDYGRRRRPPISPTRS
jgi:hypothetical protein